MQSFSFTPVQAKASMKLLLITALLLFSGTLQATSPARAQDTNYVQVTITPARTHVAGGDVLMLAIEQNIAPEWHTYWVNPGDSGAAPRVTWTMPEGFSAGDLQWPTPHRIPYADLMNFGYEGSVTLLQQIAIPPTLPEGPVTLNAEMEILVCKDICIPEIKSLSLTLNDPAATPMEHPHIIGTAQAMMPSVLDGGGTFSEENGDLVVTITASALPETLAQSATLLPLEWGIIRNFAPTRVDRADATTLVLRHERDTRALSEVSRLPVVLAYSTAEGQYAGLSVTLERDPSIAATQVPEDAAIQKPATMGEADTAPALTLAQALLFALLGGVILNLMPCVFPVLSIKALKLSQIRDKGPRAAIANGAAYTAGIVVSFALVGAVLLTIKAAGGQIGWGFQLQNPLVILALAYLLFVIGLNFSGLFDIGSRFANAGSGLTQKGGLSGAFFTGVLATLVATPCTAPFMAGALGFALVQPAGVAMGIFVALGLGLALPYLALCVVPGAARILPRPGNWMIRFKEFLAFPMYGSAAWLVWVLTIQTGATGVLWALSGMVAIAFTLWLVAHRPEQGAKRIVVTILILATLAFAAAPFIRRDALPVAMPAVPEMGATLGVTAFTPESLAAALAGDDPVFVYMTAAWCITCKVNEKTALKHPDTIALFSQEKVTVLEGDWTMMNPEITKFLKSHGRSGVPLYAYYGRKDPATGMRPDAVILPQVLTPGIIRAYIRPTQTE